jgi:hypothetical protein
LKFWSFSIFFLCLILAASSFYRLKYLACSFVILTLCVFVSSGSRLIPPSLRSFVSSTFCFISSTFRVFSPSACFRCLAVVWCLFKFCACRWILQTLHKTFSVRFN